MLSAVVIGYWNDVVDDGDDNNDTHSILMDAKREETRVLNRLLSCVFFVSVGLVNSCKRWQDAGYNMSS
jgi:hypothetical protein